jgi:hypothetical protein
MILSRKDEIKQVAKETYPNEGWEFQRVSFVRGAMWADEHPSNERFKEKAHEWIEKYIAEATGIDSSALIESFDEMLEENK